MWAGQISFAAGGRHNLLLPKATRFYVLLRCDIHGRRPLNLHVARDLEAFWIMSSNTRQEDAHTIIQVKLLEKNIKTDICSINLAQVFLQGGGNNFIRHLWVVVHWGGGKANEIVLYQNLFWLAFFNTLNYPTLQLPSMVVTFFTMLWCESMTTLWWFPFKYKN